MYAQEGYQLTIDLEHTLVREPDGRETSFEIDELRRYRLLHGLDDIGLTLEHADSIRAYESRARESSPWLFAGFGDAGPSA